jgi:hypothetical protein
MAISVDGTEQFYLSGTAVLPAGDPSFGGYTIYLHNEADGTNHANDVALGNYTGTNWKAGPFPIDQTLPIYDVYAVSFDVNHNPNTLDPGVTPRVTGLQPVPQTTGSLKANRIDPTTLDSTLGVFGGTLGVPDATLLIQKFNLGIRPVVLFSSDPSLPNAQYPAGTYGFNTTSHILKRVNSAGTTWELGVNGATDIQANTITAGSVAAGAIGTTQLTTGQILVGGGGGRPGELVVTDGSGTAIGWIGTDSGNVGAWFKTCAIGGSSYAAAPFQVNSSGDITITGTGTNVAIAVQSVFAGITSTISLGGAINGLTVSQTISAVTYQATINGSEIAMVNQSNSDQAAFLFDGSGRPYCVIAAGSSSFTNVPFAFHTADSSHYSALGPASLTMTGLPSSNPGAGSKQFWYDPSDSNRIKYAP